MGEVRHAAASLHQASPEGTRLGAEGRAPTVDQDREKEEAVRQGEAIPPSEAPAEDPLGDHRWRSQGWG